MGATIMDPARLILADAADLIAARGWDRLADPYATDGAGALSVRGAMESATDARDWEACGAAREVTSDDGMCALAAYVIDMVLIPVHICAVSACPVCVQCREHKDRPLALIRNQACSNGCALCGEHAHLIDPHGYDQPLPEEMIDAWEGFMPHQRDVITGLRAAASRLGL